MKIAVIWDQCCLDLQAQGQQRPSAVKVLPWNLQTALGGEGLGLGLSFQEKPETLFIQISSQFFFRVPLSCSKKKKKIGAVQFV